MKTTLIYFSGTGNSLAVTRLLAKKIAQTTIVSVKDMLKRSSYSIDTEVCGIVFPVYCQDAPEMVKRLTRFLEIPEKTHLFALATHNGDVGYSHYSLDGIFKKKGRRLVAGYAVLMPGNSNSEAEQIRRLRASASLVDGIADSIIRKEILPFEGSVPLKKHIKGMRNMFRYKVLYRLTRKFWATKDCDHCGLCARICPEMNIRVDPTSIIWGKRCQMCQACLHWCPRRAVQNGPQTIDRRRYHHPDIIIEDMISPR